MRSPFTIPQLILSQKNSHTNMVGGNEQPNGLVFAETVWLMQPSLFSCFCSTWFSSQLVCGHQWQGLPLGIRCNMSAFPRGGKKELQLLYFPYDPKCFYINFVISCIGSKTHLRTTSFQSGLLFRFRRTLVKKLHWILNLFLPYISYLKQTEILINFYFHAIQLEILFIRMPQNILYHY